MYDTIFCLSMSIAGFFPFSSQFHFYVHLPPRDTQPSIPPFPSPSLFFSGFAFDSFGSSVLCVSSLSLSQHPSYIVVYPSRIACLVYPTHTFVPIAPSLQFSAFLSCIFALTFVVLLPCCIRDRVLPSLENTSILLYSYYVRPLYD